MQIKTRNQMEEQLSWIEETMQGEFDALFFSHLPYYNLAGTSPKMNPEGNPKR